MNHQLAEEIKSKIIENQYSIKNLNIKEEDLMDFIEYKTKTYEQKNDVGYYDYPFKYIKDFDSNENLKHYGVSLSSSNALLLNNNELDKKTIKVMVDTISHNPFDSSLFFSDNFLTRIQLTERKNELLQNNIFDDEDKTKIANALINNGKSLEYISNQLKMNFEEKQISKNLYENSRFINQAKNETEFESIIKKQIKEYILKNIDKDLPINKDTLKQINFDFKSLVEMYQKDNSKTNQILNYANIDDKEGQILYLINSDFKNIKNIKEDILKPEVIKFVLNNAKEIDFIKDINPQKIMEKDFLNILMSIDLTKTLNFISQNIDTFNRMNNQDKKEIHQNLIQKVSKNINIKNPNLSIDSDDLEKAAKKQIDKIFKLEDEDYLIKNKNKRKI